MRCSFSVFGHPNILSTHKSTLEFTKDADVTKSGDCIVGVNADFSLKELQEIIRTYRLLRLTVEAKGQKDWFEFVSNVDFDDDKEIVIRTSEFPSGRTLGFKCTKAANDLDRKLIRKLKDDRTIADVTIEPKIKLFIFDFDDTVEDFKACYDHTTDTMAKSIAKRYRLDAAEIGKAIRDIDVYYSHKGVGASPKNFDRHPWFRCLSKRFNLDLSDHEVEDYVKEYWRLALDKAKPLPHARQLLSEVRKRFKIAMMSDSDGDVNIKLERIKKTGLYDYFDFILTSDHVSQNKPSKRFYKAILTKFDVQPDECVMVGDKPEVDLKLAKELGMTTVHVNHGVWTELETVHHQDYIDYEVNDLQELIDIVKRDL